VAARWSAAILTAWALGFLVLAARVVRSRGPIEWRAPSTVVSNSHPAQQAAVPVILFLREVRPLLPAGSSVVVFGGPNVGTESSTLDDLIAIGQLPKNDVVSSRQVQDRAIPPPRFLAVRAHTYSDDRYRVVAALGDGQLYELRP